MRIKITAVSRWHYRSTSDNNNKKKKITTIYTYISIRIK